MIAIDSSFLDKQKIDYFFITEENFICQENFEEKGLELGDSVYLVGFPMGISGIAQNFAIVRSGTIARIDDELIQLRKNYFIDAMVFPGNSGGPVFVKPENLAIENTKSIDSIFLIGVVSGYIPYLEPLYSHQSNPPMIAGVSSNNSGLATIVPMNYAKDIYNDFVKKNKKLEEITLQSNNN